ncbi:hypothetical protein, partial [Paenibacillus dendritiformis]|uniref:hypothetical protein n=1 Tax=Paenibacillus dendritiformis TaxID=130049 RepID=UPI001C27A7BF
LHSYIILGPFELSRRETCEIAAVLQDSLSGEVVPTVLLYLCRILPAESTCFEKPSRYEDFAGRQVPRFNPLSRLVPQPHSRLHPLFCLEHTISGRIHDAVILRILRRLPLGSRFLAFEGMPAIVSICRLSRMRNPFNISTDSRQLAESAELFRCKEQWASCLFVQKHP